MSGCEAPGEWRFNQARCRQPHTEGDRHTIVNRTALQPGLSSPRGAARRTRPRRVAQREDIMHRSLTRAAAHAAVVAASILGTAVGAQAGGFVETDLVANKSPLTDSNGIVHTVPNPDPNLVNP